MFHFTPINNGIKEEDVGDVPEAPKTPSKRKNGAQGGTPKKAKNDTPRKMNGKNIKASKIPETFDELAEEDKMMIEWKEVSEKEPSTEKLELILNSSNRDRASEISGNFKKMYSQKISRLAFILNTRNRYQRLYKSRIG